jgi:hypothetical protein
VAHGLDPAALKSKERRAATLKELADLFISEHVEAKRKQATSSHYRDILERIVLPELGARQGEKVTTADLARLHARIKKRPYQANRMLAVISSLYTFAGKRMFVPIGFNPARGIDKYPERGRERFLTTEELGRLGDALREAETVGLPMRVLALARASGCRSSASCWGTRAPARRNATRTWTLTRSAALPIILLPASPRRWANWIRIRKACHVLIDATAPLRTEEWHQRTWIAVGQLIRTETVGGAYSPLRPTPIPDRRGGEVHHTNKFNWAESA